MKYGQIAGNSSINAMIYRCFEHITDVDARKFVKKFKDQLDDEVQVMHTFRELILGAYLISSGLNVRYEYTVGTKTPDWCVLDESSSPKSIVELTNFHLDKATEDDIEGKLQSGGIWVGWLGQNDERLYQSIRSKVSNYKVLIEQFDIPFVIGLFGGFWAAVNTDELDKCLFDEGTGLFRLYNNLSGVLFFEESSGRYSFSYIRNPNSFRKIDLPSGIF